MKVTIQYEFKPQYEHKYWAITTTDEHGYISSCGHSWEDAEKRLMTRLAELTADQPPIPAPKEVELEVSVHVS